MFGVAGGGGGEFWVEIVQGRGLGGLEGEIGWAKDNRDCSWDVHIFEGKPMFETLPRSSIVVQY